MNADRFVLKSDTESVTVFVSHVWINEEHERPETINKTVANRLLFT